MDIVKQLRYEAKTARENHPETFCVSEDTADAAADEIERLREVIANMINLSNDLWNTGATALMGEEDA